MHFGSRERLKKLFVAGGLTFAHGGKMLIFVTDEHEPAENAGLDEPPSEAPGLEQLFQIELHHYTEGLCQPRILSYREIERADLSVSR